MAFNPFHRFRKHQKAIFAVLTIVCMFVFILSFGPGDIFSKAFRNARERGELVTTLYGRKIYMQDLSLLLAQRKMINEFILGPSDRQNSLWNGLLGQAVAASREQLREALTKIEGHQIAIIRGVLRNQEERNNPFATPLPEDVKLSQLRRDIRTLTDLRLRSSDQKPEVKKAISDLLVQIQLDAYFSDLAKRNRNEFWFGGGRTTEDLLDFMIWRHQADRLGINLGETEVIKGLNAEMCGQDVLKARSFVKDPEVALFLRTQERNNRLATADELLKAVKDELRVVMAKEALLGVAPGFRAYRGGIEQGEGAVVSPAAVTPEQFYDFYRKERTTSNLSLLEVPVESFTKEVKEKPAEEDLRKLFDKYKDQTPDPARENPGFKEPRKVRGEYVSFKAELPVFQAEGKALALHGIVTQLTMPMSGLSFGATPAAWAIAIATPILKDPLLREYERYESREKNLRWDDQFGPVPRDAHLYRLGTLTFTAGQFLGAARMPTPAGASGLSTTYSTLVASAMVYQEAERKRAMEPYYTAVSYLGIAPIGLNPLVLSSTLYRQVTAETPRYLSQAEVAVLMLNDVAKREAATQMGEAAATFYKELSKLKGTPDKAAAYVADSVKKWGLESMHHLMGKAEDRYALVSDPALQPFKKAFEESSWGRLMKKVEFVDLFLSGRGVYEPRRWAGSMTMNPYMAESEWRNSPEPYVCWRSEDRKEREPTFAEARERVEAAWTFMAARRLARKKADELSEIVKTKYHDSPNEAIKFLRDQKRGLVFDLSGVARLVEPFSAIDSLNMEYQPYTVPKKDITYPWSGFVDRVMSLEQRGDSLVVGDQPLAHYYVVVLRDRSVPTMEKFLEVYARSPGGDPLWSQNALATIRQDYEQEALRELRVNAAGKVDEDGHLILPANVSKNLEAPTDTGE